MSTTAPPVRSREREDSQDTRSETKAILIRILSILIFLSLLAAAWTWTPLKDLLDPQKISAWIAPYRGAWYALPAVMAAFVVLGLVMVSVLLLIVATGVAFGPWLGSLYALAGALASASVGFCIGRWAGIDRLEKVAGEKVRTVSRKIERNGTLAVYVIRKIPLPFTLVNVVIGASRVRFRDFFLGSVLGMGPIVVALAGFGYQLSQVVEDPTPGKIALAIAFLAIPLSLAWVINHFLKRGRSE